jgi:hypothetical protein
VTADRLFEGWGGYPWIGDVAELVVYTEPLTDSQRIAVEDYLVLKYALYVGTAGAPEFSPNGGTFTGSVQVSLASPTLGAEIRYTTNGSEPDTASTLYTGPFVLTESSIVQARTFHAAMNPSPVAVASFARADDQWPSIVPGLRLWARADVGVVKDETGRVREWRDVSGLGNHLRQTEASGRPLFVPDAAGDLPVVRFDGSNDTLLFTSRLTAIRTVFWVLREDAAATDGYHHLLGDASSYDFYSGASHEIWSAAWASPAVRNGVTRLNGTALDGTVTNRPVSLSLISLVTTGDVTADAFSRYAGSGESWWGDLAELIVYDRELTGAERKSVEDHLALKYGLYVPTPAAPVFTPNGSTASATVRVTLSAEPGVQIRYTTDGTEPGATSALYAAPLVFTTPTTARARAYRTGHLPSAVATAKFLDATTPAPLRAAGLKLWVRADAGITASGGLVSAWADQSGNANHLVQPTSAERPEVVTGQANGLPVLRFDGAGDTLLFTSRLTDIRTVFWVIRRSAEMTPDYRLLLGDSLVYDFHPDYNMKIWGSYTSTAITSGQTRLDGVLVDGSTTDRPTDLSLISLVTTGSVSADAFSRDRVYDRSWWGDLAELIVYDRPLTEAERQPIESYLASKYALFVPTVATPTISPAGGRLTSTQLVQLDCATPGATIRYTLDDTEPSATSTPYTGGFEVDATTRVRARAFLAGWNDSPQAVVTFFDEGEPSPASLSGLALWVRADAGLEPDNVSLWRDQGGAGNDLVQSATIQRPLVLVDETNDMPFVRFDGAGDTLLFTSRLTGIRTVFWVIRRSAEMTPDYRMLLGDSIGYDFHPDYSMTIWGSYTSSSITSGETRVDGALVDGLTTDRPADLSVISLVTTGSVSADAFSRDRLYDRSWWGDLAELVIYDRPLDASERRAVEEYLAGRYGVELAPE